jgi:hypothetical protein
VLKEFSNKIKGSFTFQIDVSDRSTFPSKKGIRCYYSFSAANDLHFKVGYGDIMVCDYATGQNDVCF